MRALTWLCRTLASLSGEDGLRRVEVWLYFQDDWEHQHVTWSGDDRQHSWWSILNDLTRLLAPIKILEGKVRRWGVGEMLEYRVWEPGNVRPGATWVARKTMRGPSAISKTRCSKVAERKLHVRDGTPFTFEKVQEYLWWLLTEDSEPFQRI